MFDGGEGEEKGAECEGGDDDSLSEGLLDLADDPLLRNDLTELARQGKGKGDNDGEGEGEGDVVDDTKWSGIAGEEVEASAGPEDSTSAAVAQGVSEDSAIIMLSDDDDDDAPTSSSSPPAAAAAITPAVPSALPSALHADWPLTELRIYRITFYQRPLGINVCVYAGRVILNRIDAHLEAASVGTGDGGGTAPSLGDFLVSVNGAPVEVGAPLKAVAAHIQGQGMPLVLVLGEDQGFRRNFRAHLEVRPGDAVAVPEKGSKPEVIE
eukprot:CAMPEP_0194286748 /NCGR_PEP_ID=MMETSP0169-20130528/33201_1 /TAXON_ID=218684 /ORGANISM="Corethron pennatum, Strain L29A3" /LENGTH=266 /DNA_ID=CAMNT_0039033261 /DNA_START=1 /DNA_END=798 /DNA_ORIENTATION=-